MADNDNVNVPKETLAGVASYINETAPRLEKLAALEQALPAVAERVADGMIEAGLVKAASRDQVIDDIANGGLEKLAEAFEFSMQKAASMQSVPSFGKSAHDLDAQPEAVTADQKWDTWVKSRA